ncbi:hypothetical protein JOQ06_017874 [Pogonophryne albipinna]|uniref:WW domain binding protein VOPP1 n=1 Tax=Pogonophryne albipinna TaxID=1090488 RepID=A0AAD6F904_9TELE|nr:hypothetical protein JOQ06_017874 [Pogonophryne albipinna]
MRNPLPGAVLSLWIVLECVEAKKYCWYFEGRYPIYFMQVPHLSHLRTLHRGASVWQTETMHPLQNPLIHPAHSQGAHRSTLHTHKVLTDPPCTLTRCSQIHPAHSQGAHRSTLHTHKEEVESRCRSYEDCCGTRCCVRALSIQRLWYFWVLLMMGVLFCCGAGFIMRRRMYPSPLRDDFNVSFTRHPANSPVSQQPGAMQGFGVNGMTSDPAGGPSGSAHMFPAQPGSAHMMMSTYPPPPSYCNHPPPSYEQIFNNADKK